MRKVLVAVVSHLTYRLKCFTKNEKKNFVDYNGWRRCLKFNYKYNLIYISESILKKLIK